MEPQDRCSADPISTATKTRNPTYAFGTTPVPVANRWLTVPPSVETRLGAVPWLQKFETMQVARAVSYTHLTLPTKA